MGSVRKAWVIFGLTVRYLLGTRRVIPMALLAAMPLVLVLGLVAARTVEFDIILFQRVMVPLFLGVVLIFVTLVNATTLIREEIEDNTIPYLLTRPISRPAILVYKYVAYVVVVLVLLAPSIVLAYGVTEAYQRTAITTDLDVLTGFVVVMVLGTAAYGGVFLFISVLVRRPLWVGLLIGFVWESIILNLPGDIPKLSIRFYIQSILKGMIRVSPLTEFSTNVPAGIAAAVLIGITLATVLVSILVFQQMEFRQKA